MELRRRCGLRTIRRNRIMRLWHQKLIPYLDRQRLLGQHRECAALRGKGWGKKHSVVNYVFDYCPAHLIAYHYLIMQEMERRGYHPDAIWKDCGHRGTALGIDSSWRYQEHLVLHLLEAVLKDENFMIFEEHDKKYMKECLDNLEEKGVEMPYEDLRSTYL